MNKKDINTEQLILEAAEQEFLVKGYAGTKTTAIAKRAGVNHAMIHYYFRTKENLFNMVFQQKIHILVQSVSMPFDHKLPFFDQLRQAIEIHFDFVAANPKLLFFIYNEVITNPERKNVLRKSIFPQLKKLLLGIGKYIEAEVEKGTIRRIKPIELLMNIIGLNVITFLAKPLLDTLDAETDEVKITLDERKENCVQFIMNGLKI